MLSRGFGDQFVGGWNPWCEHFHEVQPSWNNLFDWAAFPTEPYQQWPWYLNSPAFELAQVTCEHGGPQAPESLYRFFDEPGVQHLATDRVKPSYVFMDFDTQLVVMAQCEAMASQDDLFFLVAETPVFYRMVFWHDLPEEHSQSAWQIERDSLFPDQVDAMYTTLGWTDIGPVTTYHSYAPNGNVGCNVVGGNQATSAADWAIQEMTVEESCSGYTGDGSIGTGPWD
ncbi:MAG: hypothetical protein AAF581_11590 [Planctomycetota bacterium]